MPAIDVRRRIHSLCSQNLPKSRVFLIHFSSYPVLGRSILQGRTLQTLSSDYKACFRLFHAL